MPLSKYQECPSSRTVLHFVLHAASSHCLPILLLPRTARTQRPEPHLLLHDDHADDDSEEMAEGHARPEIEDSLGPCIWLLYGLQLPRWDVAWISQDIVRFLPLHSHAQIKLG